MERGEILDRLAKAQGRLERGNQVLMKQRELVELLRFMGRDTTGASKLLGVCEQTRQALVDDLNQLLVDVNQLLAELKRTEAPWI